MSAWMRTQRLNVKALTVGSLGIAKVGDIFEAILGLLLLDYDSKASFKSPHQAQLRLHELLGVRCLLCGDHRAVCAHAGRATEVPINSG